MKGESGERVGDELECVTSSAEYVCKADGMRQEVDFRDEVMHSEISNW